MEKVSKNSSSILKNILNKDFIISAIIPVAICLVFNKFNAIITLYSNISSPLLLAFSIAFPKWYNRKFK